MSSKLILIIYLLKNLGLFMKPLFTSVSFFHDIPFLSFQVTILWVNQSDIIKGMVTYRFSPRKTSSFVSPALEISVRLHQKILQWTWNSSSWDEKTNGGELSSIIHLFAIETSDIMIYSGETIDIRVGYHLGETV